MLNKKATHGTFLFKMLAFSHWYLTSLSQLTWTDAYWFSARPCHATGPCSTLLFHLRNKVDKRCWDSMWKLLLIMKKNPWNCNINNERTKYSRSLMSASNIHQKGCRSAAARWAGGSNDDWKVSGRNSRHQMLCYSSFLYLMSNTSKKGKKYERYHLR